MNLHDAVWVAVVALVVLCEVLGLLFERWPTLGDVVSWLMRPVVGRWVVLLAWSWLGWHALVR
jgi:hypothetical protein